MTTRSPSDNSATDYDLTTRDVDTITEERIEFIRGVVDESGTDGVVVALSGGIDSTTVATLAVEALGTEAVFGLVLPTDASSGTNMADAKRVVGDLGIDYRSLDLKPLLDQFSEMMHSKYVLTTSRADQGRTRVFEPTAPAEKSSLTTARGNATARLRMAAAYYEANTTNRLVLGTGNRTELLLGYFTKYGDGGVDLLPLGDLYKTTVRELARHLGVSERIVEKPPTAGLWSGQTDEAELGAAYPTIDAVLELLVDEGRTIQETADALDLERSLVEKFATMYEESAHKRNPPPTP
jgi:NAD+ synthase